MRGGGEGKVGGGIRSERERKTRNIEAITDIGPTKQVKQTKQVKVCSLCHPSVAFTTRIRLGKASDYCTTAGQCFLGSEIFSRLLSHIKTHRQDTSEYRNRHHPLPAVCITAISSSAAQSSTCFVRPVSGRTYHEQYFSRTACCLYRL